MDSFYTRGELLGLGFRSVGEHVLVSRRCSLYGTEGMSLGDHVRIDDFCLLSGDIRIGSRVHIAAYSALYGSGGIDIGDHCGLSPRCTLLSATDDFSGRWLVSPMAPPELTHVTRAPIRMRPFCQFGAGTTVLPGVLAEEGAATGACSLVLRDLPPWSVSWGVPCRTRKARERTAKGLACRMGGLS